MRRRIRDSAAAFSEKRWRKDLAEWDSVDKPGAVGKHHALLAVRPGELDDAGLVAHCRDCETHLEEMIDLHHFAGQHATVLGIRKPAAIAEAIGRVHASAHAASALAYRRKLGLAAEPRMGVVVQTLIQAEVAGVLFSRDPLTGEDVRTVESSWGLGEAVVAGLVTPDRHRVARGGRVMEGALGEKDLAIRWSDSDDGTEEQPVPDALMAAHSLDERQLAALDVLATRCEEVFGGTQDLEFAFAGGALFLLQRRAITRG